MTDIELENCRWCHREAKREMKDSKYRVHCGCFSTNGKKTQELADKEWNKIMNLGVKTK